MSQNLFAAATSLSLPLVDSNFTELYDLRNVIRTPGYTPPITRLTIDASGRFLFNAESEWTLAAAGTSYIPRIQLTAANLQDSSIFALRYSTSSSGAILCLAKSRGAAVQDYASVLDNDDLGYLYFQGSDGAAMVHGATILAKVDGTPGSGSLPTELIFRVNPGLTASPSNRLLIRSAGDVTPGADNSQPLGGASFRWSTVYAGTGSINTSDAREKTAVRALSTAEVQAAKNLAAEIGAFKFLASIADKGEAAARHHIGMTVQRAIEIMEAESLDPFAYGFICHDEWDEIPATEGSEARPAGDRYSFRIDELLLFIARGFEARLAALEAALA